MSRATGWRTTREARTGREGQHRARRAEGGAGPPSLGVRPDHHSSTEQMHPESGALGVSTNYRVDVIKLLRFGNGPMCDFAIVDV